MRSAAPVDEASLDATTSREFAAGWPTVLAANLGLAVGVATVPAFAISVFMRAMQAEFGWTRAEISLGPTITIGILALTSPLIGWMTDRIRTVWICTVGLLALAAAMFLFSRLGPDLRIYYAACAALAVLASGAGTVPYARAVSASFVRARGMALGIAMVGSGISAMLIPMLLAPYAARAGWRAGYEVLALTIVVVLPAITVLLWRAPSPSRTSHHIADVGVPFAQAVRDPVFWTLALSFILIPLAVGGMQLHLLSFMADAGVATVTAGIIAGLTGVIQIISRLLCGWLVDRFFAARVAAVAMALAAASLASLAVFGAPAAVLGPIAFGLAMGAEIDLVGYMTARYFGMRAYGRLYGLLYATIMVGSALSPVFYGSVFDAAKSYVPALLASAAMLLVSALLFLTLRRFEPLAEQRVPGEAVPIPSLGVRSGCERHVGRSL